MRTALRLLSFLRPFAGEVLLSVLLGAATVASGIGLLGTSAFLITTAALQPSIAALEVAIVGVRFFGICRGVFRYLERLVSHSTNFRLLAGLRVWFYQTVEPLAPARLETLRGGDLLTRAVGDIEVLEDFYVRLVAPPLVALLITLGVGMFVGRSAWQLGWMVAAGLLIGGGVLPSVVYLLVRPEGEKISRSRSVLNVALVDAVQGMTEWYAYGQETAQLAKIRSAGGEYDRVGERARLIGAAGEALGLVNHQLWVWLVVVAAIPLVRSGQMDGVALAVAAMLTGAAFEAVLPLNQAAQQLEGALQSARRLFALAQLEPAVKEAVDAKAVPAQFHLRIDHLTFHYPGQLVKALEDFSLDLPIGKHVALVGPSGAGKSTVASLLLRFWDAPDGTITLNGEEIGGFGIESLRQRIAVIPPSAYLFSGTLDENIRLGNPSASPQEVADAIRSARLDALIGRLPAGVRHWLGAQGEQLSGGERQRVAAARAFLKPAGLLLMDEPAANLDPVSARELLHDLVNAVEERSLIWITHDLSGLEPMDEIIVLRDGRVIERGTHAELTSLGGWYAQALSLQRSVLI